MKSIFILLCTTISISAFAEPNLAPNSNRFPAANGGANSYLNDKAYRNEPGNYGLANKNMSLKPATQFDANQKKVHADLFVK